MANFGGERPGFAGRTATGLRAPSDATVSITITGDTEVFSLSHIAVSDVETVLVDPTDLPPGHPPVRTKQEVVYIDVTNPDPVSEQISLAQDDDLLVEVRAVAPRALSPDHFSGMLTIRGDGTTWLQEPLSMFLGEVRTTVEAGRVRIARGHSALVPILAQLIVGPETEVRYTLAETQLHTGLTVEADPIHLTPASATGGGELKLTAAGDAPLGPNTVFIRQFSFSTLESFPLDVEIVLPEVNVAFAESSSITIRRGAASSVPIRIDLNGSFIPTDVRFTPRSLPQGISTSETSFYVSGVQTVALTIRADFTALKEPAPFVIDWGANTQTGTLNGIITSMDEQLLYDTGTVEADTVRGWAQLTISSAGEFSYRGHVHENGVVGHNFAFWIALKDVGSSHDLLFAIRSEGLAGTVNPFGSRDDDWQQPDGHDARIANNWDLIKERGFAGFAHNLHVATDLGQALLAAIEALPVAVVGAVVSAFLASPDTHCTWFPDRTQPQPSPSLQEGSRDGAFVRCE